MAPQPGINDTSAINGYLKDIEKHDGALASHLWTSITAGDVSRINSDMAKVKSLGLTGDFNAISAWLNKQHLKQAPKTWGDLGDVAQSVQGLASEASKLGSTALGGLFQKNLWLRVAEVGLGLLLITVGLAKLTNAIPIATKIAKHL